MKQQQANNDDEDDIVTATTTTTKGLGPYELDSIKVYYNGQKVKAVSLMRQSLDDEMVGGVDSGYFAIQLPPAKSLGVSYDYNEVSVVNEPQKRFVRVNYMDNAQKIRQCIYPYEIISEIAVEFERGEREHIKTKKGLVKQKCQ